MSVCERHFATGAVVVRDRSGDTWTPIVAVRYISIPEGEGQFVPVIWRVRRDSLTVIQSLAALLLPRADILRAFSFGSLLRNFATLPSWLRRTVDYTVPHTRSFFLRLGVSPLSCSSASSPSSLHRSHIDRYVYVEARLSPPRPPLLDFSNRRFGLILTHPPVAILRYIYFQRDMHARGFLRAFFLFPVCYFIYFIYFLIVGFFRVTSLGGRLFWAVHCRSALSIYLFLICFYQENTKLIQ